jgi:triacylglycerol lipase
MEMTNLWACLTLAMNLQRAEPSIPDTVVVLHGMGRTRFSMTRVARDLCRQGYDVLWESYPSTRWSVEKIAQDWLHPLLVEKVRPGSKVHFVTHSLGGIVVRQYLASHTVPNLGRVVMLAPPNRGSELSDLLRHFPPARWYNGPALSQLTTESDSLPNRLGPVPAECGVIAGNVSLNPLFSLVVKGPSDGKVAVERTRLDGQTGHLILPYSHTWLMNRKQTLKAVSRFLSTGSFNGVLEGASGANGETRRS